MHTIYLTKTISAVAYLSMFILFFFLKQKKMVSAVFKIGVLVVNNYK